MDLKTSKIMFFGSIPVACFTDNGSFILFILVAAMCAILES